MEKHTMPDTHTLTDFPPLYAWMGEDEHGSGTIGIKQGYCNAGYIPLVSYERHKIERFAGAMKEQAATHGKTIRLIRYVPQEIILTVG